MKFEHLFWDWSKKRFAVIDWGNSLWLNENGITDDHQGSKDRDYRQFIKEIGNFLGREWAEFRDRLNWPPAELSPDELREQISRIRETIQNELLLESQTLSKEREREADLLSRKTVDIDTLHRIDAAQRMILKGGERPDYASIRKLSATLISEISEGEKLAPVIEWFSMKPFFPKDEKQRIKLLNMILSIPKKDRKIDFGKLGVVIADSMRDDWLNVLWNLNRLLGAQTNQDWCLALKIELRRMITGSDLPLPVILAHEYYKQVQIINQNLKKRYNEEKDKNDYDLINNITASIRNNETLESELKNVIQNWSIIPSNIALPQLFDYELFGILQKAESIPSLMETAKTIKEKFFQIQNLISQAHNLWEDRINDSEGKSYDPMRKVVKTLFAWDPTRLQLVEAYDQIGQAEKGHPDFLKARRKEAMSSGDKMLSSGGITTDPKKQHALDDFYTQLQRSAWPLAKEAVSGFPSEQAEHYLSMVVSFSSCLDLKKDVRQISAGLFRDDHQAKEGCQVLDVMLEWRNTLRTMGIRKAREVLTKSVYLKL